MALVTLGVGSVLAPSDLFYDFSFPELRPFSWGEPGRRAKKSYPTPLWGHRLPVTALALSARGLDHDNFDDNRDNYDDNHDNYDDNQDTCEVSLKVLLDSVSLLVSPQPYTHPVEPGICP